MKTSNTTATKQDIGTMQREQKHDRVSIDTIVIHVEVQMTCPGIQELHVVGYFHTSISDAHV